jgi:Ca2+-binding EF-hand superfamily protein
MRKQWEDLRKKYDANANGNLDPDEMETLRKDSEAGKIEGMPRAFFGRGPRSNSGRQGPSRDAILKNADQDGDGKLNEDERRDAREAIEKQRAERAKKTQPNNP